MNKQASHIERLAARSGFPYEEIQKCFQAGYSRVEIERACRLGDEMDALPSDILAMREVGMDWQQIRKALRAVPDPDEDDEGYQ